MDDLNKDEHINEGEVHKKLPPQPLSSSKSVFPESCLVEEVRDGSIEYEAGCTKK